MPFFPFSPMIVYNRIFKVPRLKRTKNAPFSFDKLNDEGKTDERQFGIKIIRRQNMTWMEVEITTTPEAEDAVTELFYREGAKGVVVESGANLAVLKDDPTVGYIDDALLGMDPDKCFIRGYFPKTPAFDDLMHRIITEIKRLPEYGLDPGGCELSIREEEEQDWANSWKQFYTPTRIGRAIVIKPTWESYTPEEGDLVVNMDPGMAFGTGTHETTKLCVMALEEAVKPGDTVFDIGCGSGILSIVAACLEARPVIGVDFDPVAVDAATANVALNGLSDAVDIREGNLMDVIDPDMKADIIVANILAEVIVVLADTAAAAIKPGGIFITSGIIHDKVAEVVDKLTKTGFDIDRVESMGEWDAVIAVKRAD